MELQKNPNEYSCLPTAFAMCMGVPVQRLLDHLLVDGGEIAFPHREGVQRYRGYHWMEVQAAAFMLGFITMMFESDPYLGYSEADAIPAKDWGVDCKAPMVVMGTGVNGMGHAVAFDPETKKYYDPRGHILDRPPFRIDMSWAIFDLKIKGD